MKFFNPQHVLSRVPASGALSIQFDQHESKTGVIGETGILVLGKDDAAVARCVASGIDLRYSFTEPYGLTAKVELSTQLNDIRFQLVVDSRDPSRTPVLSFDPFALGQLSLATHMRPARLEADYYEDLLNFLRIDSTYSIPNTSASATLVRPDPGKTFTAAVGLLLDPGNPIATLVLMDLNPDAAAPPSGNWFNITNGQRAIFLGVVNLQFCEDHKCIEHEFVPAQKYLHFQAFGRDAGGELDELGEMLKELFGNHGVRDIRETRLDADPFSAMFGALMGGRPRPTRVRT